MAIAVTKIRGPCRRHAVALLLAFALPGCAGMNDESLSNAFGAPGKYDLYTCNQIAEQIRANRAREQELAQLMARSAQGPGGELVNTLAYRTDYLRARGELKVLIETARNKNCTSQSQWQSDRSLF